MKHGRTLVMVNLFNRNTDIWIWLETLVLFSVVMASKKDWSPSIYDSTDICGRRIGYDDSGGVLVFNSLSLPSINKYFCRISLHPKPTARSSTSGNFVLFHFTDFEVGRNCKDTSITVLDGNGMFMEPLKGLEHPLCGDQSNLTNNVTFISTSYFITLVFRNNKAGSNFKSKFNLTFLSFYEGPCGSDDDDLFSCNNNRCIDKKFTCRDWNACGDNSDCADDRFILDKQLLRYIQIGGLVLTCVITTYLVYLCIKCVKKCLKKCSGTCSDCVSDIRYNCRDVDCSCCRDLLGGAFDSCRRLKSNLTSRQELPKSNLTFQMFLDANIEQSRDSARTYRRTNVNRQSERPESTEMLPQRWPVQCPDLHIEDERNGLHTYESPPRNRFSESRIYDSDLHERLWAQPRHTDTAMYSEADELSMLVSLEMSDSDDNYVDMPLTRDMGGHVDAPPSYHEATASAPPNETYLDNSSRSASPPSYDDFLTNQSRYATSNN